MSTELENQNGMNEENFFDQPIEVQHEEDDGLIQYDAEWANQDTLDDLFEHQDPGNPDDKELNFGEESNEGESSSEENQGQKDENDLNFDDEVTEGEEDKDVFKEEEVIQKLKDLGYNVEKGSDTEDPRKQKLSRIDEIETSIGNIEKIIEMDDISLCRQKVIQDLMQKYKKEGRENMVNTEEFRLEIESQMDDYNYNDRLANLQASQLRTELKQYIAGERESQNKIRKEVEEEDAKQIKTNRLQLQDSFKSLNGKNLFGLNVEKSVLETAYKKMVSGEVAKTINNDKQIQAEFAVYLELRDKINESRGGTYGEGVAAAVNALNGNPQNASRSSLNKTVQRTSSGNNTSLQERYQHWGNRTQVANKG